MEERKYILVTNIEWDAPKSVKRQLPKNLIIDIDDENEYLLEDIEDYADNLSDYLSDTYEYCHEGFDAKVKKVKIESSRKKKNRDLEYYDAMHDYKQWQNELKRLLNEEEPDESSIERAKKVILILKQVYFDKSGV